MPSGMAVPGYAISPSPAPATRAAVSLPHALRALGFGAVTFCYALRTQPSSYLARAESPLVDFTPEELHTAFEAVKVLSREFAALNPVAPIEHTQRHLRGEPEMFACLAGWKFFYLDWHLQLWRCHNWDRPLCDIRDFRNSARARRLRRLHDRIAIATIRSCSISGSQ